jgi:hypothetical protein
MKTTNNYEAPVAEMIEMNMPVVLMASGDGAPLVPGGQPGNNPGIPMP